MDFFNFYNITFQTTLLPTLDLTFILVLMWNLGKQVQQQAISLYMLLF